MALDIVTRAEPVFAALATAKPVVIGFFSQKSEVSRSARPAFEQFCAENAAESAFLVDVTEVPEVHPRFEITAIPTVLLVRDGKVVQRITGPQKASFYARALKVSSAAAPPAPSAGAAPPRRTEARPAHAVVVYTTDVCPWCTRVKSYLRQNQIAFREINVQHDRDAARRMVERSGQQGVPQIDIDGRVVVGFDKGRIDSLLGLVAPRA